MNEKRHKKFWNNGYVIFLDILGFSKGVLSTNSHSFLHKYEKAISDVIEKIDSKNMKYIVFSDSIIIYLNGFSKGNFTKIVKLASGLFNSLVNNELPVKGCISAGRYRVNNIGGNLIIAGEPIIDAYNYEQKQNWIGIMISPSLYESHNKWLEEFTEKIPIVKYCDRIPFHDKQSNDKFCGYTIMPCPLGVKNSYDLMRNLVDIKKELIKMKLSSYEVSHQRKFQETINILSDQIRFLAGYGPEGSIKITPVINPFGLIREDNNVIIQFGIRNDTEIKAENITGFIEILNENNFEKIIPIELMDVTIYNILGSKKYSFSKDALIQGYNWIVGSINFHFKKNKKKISIRFSISANKMDSQETKFDLIVTKNHTKVVSNHKMVTYW